MHPATHPPHAPTRPRAGAGRARALLALLAMVGAWLLVAPTPAGAHAQVRETSPVDGQVLEEVPGEVSVTFDEGVQLPTAGLRVYDDAGERVDDGEARVDPEDPSRIVVGLRPDLDEGTYIVTWRAVSADGHPIKGAWLWSVGEGGEVGEDLVAALFSGGGDTPLAAAAVLVRGLGIAAVLALGGGALFWLVVQRRVGTPDEDAGLAAVARRAAWVVVATCVAGIPLQAMLETGLGVGALAPAPLLDVLTSPVGAGAVLRALLAGVVLALLRPVDGGDEVPGGGWAAPVAWAAVAAALTLPLDGHTLTQDPVALMLAADVVHVLAAAAWGGGLLALWLVVRRRRRADDPVGAARLVAGFSRLATWSLLAVAVAGGTMSWVTVRAARALASTDYGWTLVVKLVLVAALVVAGLYNNRRLVPAVVAGAAPAGGAPDADAASPPPAGDADAASPPTTRVADGAWVRLRRTLRVEVALVAAVALVTGLLVGQQPAAQEAGVTGAFTTYVELTDELEVNVVVDPNRAGVNEVHVYLLDRTGRTVDAEQVRFVLEQPARDLGPFERVPEDAGPGHWSLVGRELAVPGQWEITVVVRTGRFDEHRVTVPVVVNS